MKENEIVKRSEHIVKSVAYFIKWRLTKSKTKQEKVAPHVLIEACTYIHADGDDHNSVRKMLGFSTGTFYWHIQEQSNGMDMKSYTHIEQNKRKHTKLSKK